MLFDLVAMAVAVLFLLSVLTLGLWVLKGALWLVVGVLLIPLKLGWWLVKGVIGLFVLGLLLMLVFSLLGPLLSVVLPLAALLVIVPLIFLFTLFRVVVA